MTAEPVPTRAMNLFYCYAHEDKELRDRLEKHLANLKRNGQISQWYDREIRPGQYWEREIDVHLNNAHIILLLVSPDFMASDYCYSIEMKRALERHAEGSARVIPIILCPVDWEDAPFSKLQVLPTDARPVTSWLDRNEAFLDIVKGIRKVIKELRIEQLLTEARALRKSRKFDEALQIIEQVIQLAPDNARAYYEKGSVFLDRLERRFLPHSNYYQYQQEALAAFEQAILLDPDYAQAYFGKGRILHKSGKYQEALVALDRAISLNPNKSEIYDWKGFVLKQLDKTEEALAAYEQALQLAPNNLSLLKNKLDLLIKLNRHEEALVTVENLIRLEPGNAGNYEQKGDSLTILKRYEEALAAYDLAIHNKPANNPWFDIAGIYNSKGDVLYQLNRYEEALAAYEQAILDAPFDSTAYRGKARVYERLAQQAYAKADELDEYFEEFDDNNEYLDDEN